MKKHIRIILCTLTLALCPFVTSGAVDLPKAGFGIQIGWAQPIIRLNSPSNPSDAKDSLSIGVKLKGFKVGLVYDASYIAGFGSSIGLNYTFGASQGEWQSLGKIANYPRSRQLVTYQEVELFVDWQYKFEVAKETYLTLYTGPSLQCGIAMDMRADRQLDSDAEITHTSYSGYNTDVDNQHFTRLNITWGVGAGFQYKRYFLRGGYDFGLINPYANRQFVDATGATIDHYTRGRIDQWSIKLGIYLWYKD